MKIEARIGIILPQARECVGPTEPGRGKKFSLLLFSLLIIIIIIVTPY